MELKCQKVKDFQIKRRTFEGKTNPAKNDNSLTSKYMPSYRYWLKIQYETYTSENCFCTKAECLGAVATAKNIVGKIL